MKILLILALLNNPINATQNLFTLKYSYPGGELSLWVGLLSTPPGVTCFIMENFDLFNQPEDTAEIWVSVVDYPGYSISNKGRMKSFKHYKFGRILPATINNNGYKRFSITNENGQKTHSAHRLIAKHFIPNPNNHPIINHINGIKTDNRVENLEWCTASENVRHAYRTGLMPITKLARMVRSQTMTDIVGKGETHRLSKRVIDKSTGNTYNTLREAAEAVGMLKTTLSYQLRGIYTNKTTLEYLL